ncbi:hypothetical protein [Lapidilactobacillus luobeiensis]|uniref:hypothetical protein n=1 Tax=Lapidilactobacillus luobeiensis TaxID=2950371 RepID=UPI0021C49877|nr:hypothetical protein [Lapidilactobacillus luobeiensis]
MINEIRGPAIESGIRADEFETMTLNEILDQMHAYRKRDMDKLREKGVMDHKQAELIAFAFNDPSKMPSIQETYPFLKGLFTEAKPKPQQQWQVDQANLIMAANRIKQARLAKESQK